MTSNTRNSTSDFRPDALSRTQTEVKLVYRGSVLAWFCILFMIYRMNLPICDVSAGFFAGLCAVAASSIFLGLVMRRRFLKLYIENLPNDVRKSSESWRSANFISFSCAMVVTICGAVLKFLGETWLVPGIFFGLGLVFLLLWRPRQFNMISDQQRPAS
jgi:hypothetical protein